MAVIGPKFVNGIDVGALRDAGVNWGKQIRDDYAKSREDINTGLKGIGQGIGYARQYVAADELKQKLLGKLDELQAARNQKQLELDDINSLRDEAKGAMVGLNGMIDDSEDMTPYSILDPDSYMLVKKYYGRKAGL